MSEKQQKGRSRLIWAIVLGPLLAFPALILVLVLLRQGPTPNGMPVLRAISEPKTNSSAPVVSTNGMPENN